ncbi:unnamed protein product [Closterium sp. NIES-64]|nr:unnamed protein product [Closterium sp. NIES-64]
MWVLIDNSFPTLMNLDLRSNVIELYTLDYLKNLTALTSLDVSSNQLSGDGLAQGYLSLPNLQYLNLFNNQLTGGIPDSIATMTSLVSLNVSLNYMEGTISPSLGRLKRLSKLAINGTKLSCPDSYSSCGVPQNASSAFCRTCPDFCATCGKSKPAALASGETPKSGLSTAAIVAIIVAVAAALAVAALLFFYCWFHSRRPKALVSSKAASQVCQEYSLNAVAKATNGWSEANLLGAGAFGASGPAELLSSGFGILMLELMTGRHVTTNSLVVPSDEEAGQQLHILPWVRQQLAQYGGNDAVVAGLKDPRMEARDELVFAGGAAGTAMHPQSERHAAGHGGDCSRAGAVLVALGGSRRQLCRPSGGPAGAGQA